MLFRSREVNEVLWLTPPTTDHALFAHYGGFDYGFGGGFAQVGTGAGSFGGGLGYGGYGGYYIAPAFDVPFWVRKFREVPADVALVKEICQEVGID